MNLHFLAPEQWALLALDGFPTRSVYLGCAVAGGAFLSIQLLLMFVGGDAPDGDADFEDMSDGLSLFSLRAIASFLTFFGLFGLYGMQESWTATETAASAAGAGLGMMAVVGWLFSLQSKLHQEGNLEPESAVGATAIVYLRVPAAGSGKGKITVRLQGRTAEFAAVTDGSELPTGTDVRVVRMVSESTFAVERA